MDKMLIFLMLSLSLFAHSQEQGSLTVAVDSTTVKIGEQLNYTLQIKADSTAQVVFPENPLFAPFELQK